MPLKEKSKCGPSVRVGLSCSRERAVAMDAWLDLREGEGDGARVAVGGEGVDPGAAGVAEAEELGDLVVGFAGGVVDGAADVAVGPGAVASAACGPSAR